MKLEESVVPSPRIAPPRTDSEDPVQGSVLAHQPETLAAFTRLYGVLWSRGELDPRLKELVRLRNARITGCGYCKNVRFAVDDGQPLSEAIVDEIRDGWEHSELSPRQKAALAYADDFVGGFGRLSDEARRAVLAEFRPEEIVELTAALALFLGFSKIAVALGPVPEMPTLVAPQPEVPA